MILDQLMEKKDLMIYIDCRIKHLNKLKKRIDKFPERQRHKIKMKFEGRMKELKQLKRVISNNKLKDKAKRYWQEAAEDGEI
jgi:hypothetical protein